MGLSGGKGGEYPGATMGDEALMAPKAHGTCPAPVQQNLMYFSPRGYARAATPPRLGRGYSVETGRGAAAAGTWMFLVDAAATTRIVRRGSIHGTSTS